MNNFNDYSFEELISMRKEILARPLPQGYSQEERIMMDKLEEHCTEQRKRYVWVVMECWKTHRDNPCAGGGERLIAVCSSYAAAIKKKNGIEEREIHREIIFS